MPETISYLDFDLVIRRADGGYRAEVLFSPEGEATADFAAPFSDLELQNFILRLGRPRRGRRRIGSPEMETAKELGQRLYDAVISGEVRACWRSSARTAEAQNTGLRLRLRIVDAPELNDIPWEYLYNSSLSRFLSLSEYTPLVRYLDLPERIRPLAVDGPLAIVVMISSPNDPNYANLDVEDEWCRLNSSLAGLIDSGQVRLKRLPDPTLSALQRELRRGGEYHVLHFIGHGGFDRQTQSGVLVLPDQAGKGHLVAADHLATILHDHRSLRLVLLNACEGSRSSREDPFSGVAQTLVQQGIPAVIAMQFEITDAAAIKFAEEFYSATADGYPVDAALAAARKAIFAQGNDIEWGTPVLYLRAPDGQLFSVNREAARQAEEERRAEAARRAEEEKRRAVAARQPEEEERRDDAARQAEEEKQRAEAARQGEKEERRADAARQADEEKQRVEAARQAEEEKQRVEAARQAEEEKQRVEAARQAEEEKQRAEAARWAPGVRRLELARQGRWTRWQKIAATITAIIIGIGVSGIFAYEATRQAGVEKQQAEPLPQAEPQKELAKPEPQKQQAKPVPQAQPHTVFRVYFDWDKYNLTPEGMQTLNLAVQAYRSGGPVRVQVNGYDDLANSSEYSQRLSERRANAVANALEGLGVPGSDLSVRGFGQNDPTVPTNPGVREPENRRVEIVFP
jgi:outer membrane protein OmpA-like peptidoglycan-associated protein